MPCRSSAERTAPARNNVRSIGQQSLGRSVLLDRSLEGGGNLRELAGEAGGVEGEGASAASSRRELARADAAIEGAARRRAATLADKCQ